RMFSVLCIMWPDDRGERPGFCPSCATNTTLWRSYGGWLCRTCAAHAQICANTEQWHREYGENHFDKWNIVETLMRMEAITGRKVNPVRMMEILRSDNVAVNVTYCESIIDAVKTQLQRERGELQKKEDSKKPPQRDTPAICANALHLQAHLIFE